MNSAISVPSLPPIEQLRTMSADQLQTLIKQHENAINSISQNLAVLDHDINLSNTRLAEIGEQIKAITGSDDPASLDTAIEETTQQINQQLQQLYAEFPETNETQQ